MIDSIDKFRLFLFQIKYLKSHVHNSKKNIYILL